MAVRRARTAHRPRRPQHFLRTSELAAELVRLADVGRNDLVVEVGAGDGMLTAELGRRAGYVVAHEIDPALAARLRQRFGPASRVLVVAGDAFDQPLPALPFRVVSNPPFDSTTRLLRLLLQDPASRLERAVLVVQWEVALKRSRCRPSTQLGLSWAPWWRIRLDRRLPAAAFRPPPSTNAGVLVVAPRSEPLLEPSEASRFRALVRSAFRSGVQELVSPVELRRLGLPRRPAPRDLGAEEFVALYRFLHGRGRA